MKSLNSNKQLENDCIQNKNTNLTDILDIKSRTVENILTFGKTSLVKKQNKKKPLRKCSHTGVILLLKPVAKYKNYTGIKSNPYLVFSCVLKKQRMRGA